MDEFLKRDRHGRTTVTRFLLGVWFIAALFGFCMVIAAVGVMWDQSPWQWRIVMAVLIGAFVSLVGAERTGRLNDRAQ